MKTNDWRMKISALACASAVALVSAGSAYGARSTQSIATIAVADRAAVQQIEKAANGRLLAIGRIDHLSPSTSTVFVLGQEFVLLASPSNRRFLSEARVGRAVALFGEISGSNYLVDAAMKLDGQYVQGASKIYLQGPVRSNDIKNAAINIGSAVPFDTSALLSRSFADRLTVGAVALIVGTQPSVGGKVLVESVRKPSARANASLGTGRPDASLGTGRPDASLGTGRPDASLGTGRPDASLGTGRPDASLGTGRANASLGTGRPDASLGTGRVDASLGTGRPDASLGTGRPDASLGTGRPDASLGTGRPDASLGTGRVDASLGTGRPDASLGTGRPDASLGTGRPDASLGTGRPAASLGTG